MVTSQKAVSSRSTRTETGLGPGAVLRFGRDLGLRKRHFVPGSFEHQAKMNLWAVSWVVDRYTSPGDLVVDPMGGAGSVLWAASMGRRVALGDIEGHWAALLGANCENLARTWIFPVSAVATQWDAKALPLRDGSVDVVITSPPYWDMFSDWHIKSNNLQDGHATLGPAYGDDRGTPSTEARNIGNVHIYELYLRAMIQVWRECKRILRPGGRLVVFIKDRIHKRQIVPIVRDTEASCRSNGFSTVASHDLALLPSRYRRVYRQQNPNGPRVDHETILVLEKGPARQAKNDIALLQGQGNLPPGGFFDKCLAWAEANHDLIFILPDDPPRGCRVRKRWGYRLAADLVLKEGIGTGDQISVYAGRFAGQYVAQRLDTLGCNVVWPFEGLNQGQRLRWLTERGF